MTCTLTHNSGSTPVIAANASRTELQIQNRTGDTIFYNRFGTVSIDTPSTQGIELANGGVLTLLGTAAARAFYAVHGKGVGTTRTLHYIADA